MEIFDKKIKDKRKTINNYTEKVRSKRGFNNTVELNIERKTRQKWIGILWFHLRKKNGKRC